MAHEYLVWTFSFTDRDTRGEPEHEEEVGRKGQTALEADVVVVVGYSYQIYVTRSD